MSNFETILNIVIFVIIQRLMNSFYFQVFIRHQAEDGTRWPQHEVMAQLNTEVDRLHQQYHVRIIGENGVAKGIIDLVNPIETW